MKFNLPRRWTLATCLIATAFIAIMLCMQQIRYLRSRAAIDGLRSRGVSVYYEWQSPQFETRTFVTSWETGTYRTFTVGPRDEVPVPSWSRLFGRTPATDVHTIVLDVTEIDADLVERLVAFPNLKQLVYRTKDGSDEQALLECSRLLKRFPHVRICPACETIRSLKMNRGVPTASVSLFFTTFSYNRILAC